MCWHKFSKYDAPYKAAHCERNVIEELMVQVRRCEKCGLVEYRKFVRPKPARDEAPTIIRMEGDVNTVINDIETGVPWEVVCAPGFTYRFSSPHQPTDNMRASLIDCDCTPAKRRVCDYCAGHGKQQTAGKGLQ